MKKILMITVLAIFAPAAMLAEFAYDERTDRYYSKHAARNVNQDEYNAIAHMIKDNYPQGVLNLSEREIAGIFAMLRVKDTPASLQLIKDMKLFIKNVKKDMKDL